MNKETVTISLTEYDQLNDDSMKLSSLENGGVNNWEWYDEALQDYYAWKEE